ncbi:MAG: peptide-methionine (S)-S-oxide reductase MsrA [Patescibacteria group bacterium]
MDTKQAVFAGGCFWGLEELFRKLPGVIDTETGYTGGENEHPTYDNHPGHAEALQITYDPSKITYKELLDFFFRIHDPSTLNRQGNDVGTSYRSAIFVTDEEERKEAEAFIQLVDKSGRWPNRIATTVESLKHFEKAEEMHQDYLQHNPGGYTCHFVRNMPSYLS